MAKSYADMYNDRFGGGGAVQELTITITNPAPYELIAKEAEKVGIDAGEYTPASVFDHNLHGTRAVARLVNSLKSLGYDGAILEDIGYGVEVAENVYIVFS